MRIRGETNVRISERCTNRIFPRPRTSRFNGHGLNTPYCWCSLLVNVLCHYRSKTFTALRDATKILLRKRHSRLVCAFFHIIYNIFLLPSCERSRTGDLPHELPFDILSRASQLRRPFKTTYLANCKDCNDLAKQKCWQAVANGIPVDWLLQYVVHILLSQFAITHSHSIHKCWRKNTQSWHAHRMKPWCFLIEEPNTVFHDFQTFEVI